MRRILFCALLGGVFGGLISMILPMPYSAFFAGAGGLALGWFGGDLHDKIFGE
jgi:hypothetical protein